MALGISNLEYVNKVRQCRSYLEQFKRSAIRILAFSRYDTNLSQDDREEITERLKQAINDADEALKDLERGYVRRSSGAYG